MGICEKNYNVKNDKYEKLSSMKIDHRLNLMLILKWSVKKEGQKQNALSRVISYMD